MATIGPEYDYLASLLNKNLRIKTSDGRLFWGQFKCTDPDSNVVLTNTYEYVPPPDAQVAAAAASASPAESRILLDMQSRYLGLVVLPGKHIVNIQEELFTSQLATSSAGGTVAT